MRVKLAPILAGLLALAGCSSPSDQAESMAVSADTAAEVAPAAPAAQNAPDKLETGDGMAPSAVPSAPQIAYVYDYGFRLSGPAIAPLQQRHADLCERKGPSVCRIIAMDQSGSEGDYVSGTLQLAVAADKARAFGKELTALAKKSDGEQIASSITGEDLSKQIVDTEAKLRARTLLRDRLMEVLATRKGTVAELVEAERGVAQVNEEIDQAQSWLAEMRTRVAFSQINLSYASGSPSSGGFLEPIRDAVGSIGSILGTVIGALILLAASLLPIALIVGAILWARRSFARSKPAEE